jgi:hypothetical protein
MRERLLVIAGIYTRRTARARRSAIADPLPKPHSASSFTCHSAVLRLDGADLERVIDMPTSLPFAGIAVGALTALVIAASLETPCSLAAQLTPASPAATNPMEHDEADMLARARAEHDAMRARSDNAGPAPASSQSTPAAADDAEEVRRRAIDAEVRRRLQEAERQAELDLISERIRAAERRRSGLGGEATSVGQGAPPDAVPPARAAVRDVGQSATRATLLLVIEPGRSGIRRFNATADPILCTGDICYISRGADRDAQPMPRSRALGILNTLGHRAGACNASLECVFRNVDLGGAAVEVQPIDLRILRHDRRRPLLVHADGSCGLLDGRLVCAEPVRGRTWRVWTVPEPVARQAGGLRLQAALDAGLRDDAARAPHGSRGVELRD